jgi:Plasmid pRiA4b ORF-3-like protein
MAKPRTSHPQRKPPRDPRPGQLYTLKVGLLSGPITNPSTEQTPLASRSIQIRGEQTLEDLHQGILRAFERSEDYSYEFQFDAGPRHPEGKRYVLPGAYEISTEAGSPAAGQVTEQTLDGLGLQVGQHFVYSPDKEDDWWHPITVERIGTGVPRGTYPKVIKRVGESPFLNAGREQHGDDLIGKDAGADAACLVGELHLSRGDYPNAIAAFTRAIENGSTVDAYEGRARAYRALAEADERQADQLRQQ